jgi:hypothetical protein
MLYLILPPIIIVLSLAILVYFFLHRYPTIDSKTAQVYLESQSGLPASGNRMLAKISQGGLSVLEYIAQWFKVMTLKAHNGLHHWTTLLREKKREALEAKEDTFEKVSARRTQEDTTLSTLTVPKATQMDASFAPRASHIRPMVSREVTKPENPVLSEIAKPIVNQSAKSLAPAPVAKSQFEDILVDRIAANPRDIEAYERLGAYYMEQGNLSDAKECYRQVLRLSPAHRLAKTQIRRLETLLEQK